jgi:hypothetical protein
VERIDWDEARWLNLPAEIAPEGSDLLVTARKGSDFWRTTSYGFERDSGHALLTDFEPGTAVEVSFTPAFETVYDQAGLLARVDEETWIKAGVEMSDGYPQLGAVVTLGSSDWSVAPVPDWMGRRVTMRASRSGDAVTVRARVDEEPWRMIRLAPFPAEVPASVGPFCCAPERAGLRVRFHDFRKGPADRGLHEH